MTLNNRRSVVVLPIFTPNTLLERACFELNENVLILKIKQGTVKWQGFKVGQSVGLAATVRARNVNVGGRWTSACYSVVSCLIFKTKVSLKRRCFQQCFELENLIKYDAGWYIFFEAMNSSFTRPWQLYRRRIGGQLTVAGHLFKLLQIRDVPWNDCCSNMAIQEQSWRPKESPEACSQACFTFSWALALS